MIKKSPQKAPAKVDSNPGVPKLSSGKPAVTPTASPKPLVKPALPTRPVKSISPLPFVKKGGITAEMRATATGSATAEDLLLALKHEGKSRHISNERYLQRFARYGWHDEEDEAAREVLKLWNKGTTSQGFRAKRHESSFAQSEDEPKDPCADGDEEARIRCYQQELSAYGVGIMDDNDLQAAGRAGDTLEQFSSEQLAIILQGVRATGDTLAAYISEILDRDVKPEEAFQLVFGTIEFGYDKDRQTGLTIGGDPGAIPDKQYILLDDSSFGLSDDDKIGFEKLPDSFVVVHELGHAFHNRSGESVFGIERIAGIDYVAATDATWYPGGGQTTNQYEFGFKLDPLLNDQGKQMVDAAGNPLYVIPPGLYIPGEENQDNPLFPNENRPRTNPSEGFADTFSNFILNPDSVPPNAATYFEENMPQWLLDMLCPEGNCDDIAKP